MIISTSFYTIPPVNCSSFHNPLNAYCRQRSMAAERSGRLLHALSIPTMLDYSWTDYWSSCQTSLWPIGWAPEGSKQVASGHHPRLFDPKTGSMDAQDCTTSLDGHPDQVPEGDLIQVLFAAYYRILPLSGEIIRWVGLIRVISSHTERLTLCFTLLEMGTTVMSTVVFPNLNIWYVCSSMSLRLVNMAE